MATSAHALHPSADRDPRQPVRMWALVDYGGACERAVVLDLSTTGFSVETTRALFDNSKITIAIGATSPLEASVVHCAHGRYGCRFATPLDEARLSALTFGGPFASAPPIAPDPDPVVEAYSPRTRTAIIAGGAVASWTAVAGIAYLLLS